MDKGNDPKFRVHARARSERQRFLNIIYFMDSRRTRTLKFTLRSASITLGVLAVLLTWSFIASGLLIHEYQTNSDLRQQTRGLLSTIFSYQTRYDEVYENAYPEKESLSSSVAASKAEEDVEDEIEAEEQDEVPNGSHLAAKSLADSKNPSSTSEAIAKSPDPKERAVSQSLEEKLKKLEFPIVIENFSTQLYSGTLVARFSLQNNNRPNKSSGLVIASAKFVDDKQKVTMVDMEVENGPSDETSEGIESSSDQHYNIRYYKNKKFSFIKPKGQLGDFASVAITLKGEDGRKKEFSFAIPRNNSYQPSETAQPEAAKGPIAKSDPEL